MKISNLKIIRKNRKAVPAIRLSSSKSGKQGFSLLEMIVAMFISTLIITTVVAAFASAFRARESAGNTQRSIEDAKTSIEYMAKTIRMSSNLQPVSGSSNNVIMFNKSQEKCIQYIFNNVSKTIDEKYCTVCDFSDPCKKGTFTTSSLADCNDPNPATIKNDCKVDNPITNSISSSLSDASFSVSGTYIKRVTVRMKMTSDTNPTMQTTVSTRDYKDLSPIGQ
jgi:prepilin-type N-terminal cleavage/methylation domain-containing protein